MIKAALELRDLSILVVDDAKANVDLLERILSRAGYTDIRSTTSGEHALALAAQRTPDLILLDLHTPGLSGLDVILEVSKHAAGRQPFVIVLTGDVTSEARDRVLSAGARDFITKPFETNEVVLRVRNLADLRLTQKRLNEANDALEEKVRERTRQLERARLEILDRLAMAAEFRDDETGHHTRRVGWVTRKIAEALGLPTDEVELIARAAPLHDLGKIAIPDSILPKPARLDSAEMSIMRTHTTIGATLLSGSDAPLLETARAIALSHHERWDGGGYPQQLSGCEIPLSGRIVAVADVFDALAHDRPYRPRRPVAEITEVMRYERGRHFDACVVDALLEYDSEMVEWVK